MSGRIAALDEIEIRQVAFTSPLVERLRHQCGRAGVARTAGADVHASQIVQWKAQLLDGAMGVFLTPAEKRESQGPSGKDMQAKIGQLALENDFLAGALGRIDGASAKK